MKDYYYILGLKQTATTEEIKKSYRKLSLKFHPDHNGGDEFFTDRFKEIQEAYETLSDNSKRDAYNIRKNYNSTVEPTNRESNFSPEIEYFRSNVQEFDYDGEITLSWKTINANKVIIKPFGSVQPIGQKTYRIKDFKNKYLNVELIAENLNINRQIKRSLTLTNKTYEDLYKHFRNVIKEEENRLNNNTSHEKKNSNFDENREFSVTNKQIVINIAVGVILFISLLYILYAN